MCFAILPLVGAAVSAAGSLAAANAQSASMKAQARAQERQATIERDRGAYEFARQRDANDRTLASNRSSYLSSGIALEGSAADVLTGQASEASLDEQAILYGSKIQQDNLNYEAKISRMNAKSAKTAGIIGAITPFVNAASDMASAAAGGGMQATSTSANRSFIRSSFRT